MTRETLGNILLSGVVGILLGGVVQAAVGRYAAFKEAQGIAAAIRAEIEATLTVLNRANHREAIAHHIKNLEIAVSAPTYNDVFTFGVNEKPFQVFDSLCNRIGLLGRQGEQIVGVYLLGKALFTNVRVLGKIQDRLLAKQMTVERKALLGFTRQVDELYRQFESDGQRAADSLAKYARRKWLILFS